MTELVLILLAALLLFGAKRLPEIGRSMGRAISAFKQGTKEGEEGSRDDDKPPSPPPGA